MQLLQKQLLSETDVFVVAVLLSKIPPKKMFVYTRYNRYRLLKIFFII